MFSIRILFILLIFSCCSCGIKNKFGEVTEGEIKYNLEYFGDEKQQPIIGILPNSMTVKFNKHHSIQKVEGWLGLFSLTGISDFDKGRDYAILKILEKKYLYEKRSGEGSFGYREFPEMEIKYCGDTKVIAGFKCKKAIILLHDLKNDTINVYYTDKIKVKNPNWNNPFKKIDGVLLEFQMDMFDIRTKVTASAVTPSETPESEFMVPENCQKVSKKEIEKVIRDMM